MSDEASVQPELLLPFPELSGDLPLLPARMVNEYYDTDDRITGVALMSRLSSQQQ